MIVLDSVALLRPLWLLALPLAMLAFGFTRAGAQGLADWERAMDPGLMQALLQRGAASGGGRAKASGLFAASLLIILALAGPAIRGANRDSLRNLDASILVIDLSAAATQGHMLQQAQTAAQQVLEVSGGRQLGLILYGGDAYLASPLTSDAAATTSLLFALDNETMPDPGERPDRALELARKILAEAKILAGDVVLVTAGSGGGTGALVEARALAGAGGTLHTLFLPQNEAGDAARRRGVAALAAGGGGVSGDAGRPGLVLSAISGRSSLHFAPSSLGVLAFRDLGQWLLLAAALPLLLSFRRSAA